MELVLEKRLQENGTDVIKMGGSTIEVTPEIGADYWSYRVKLSKKQAVVGFPKFSTIGVGFAVEKDWNTNLPYHVPVEKLFQHIKHNKGSRSIADDDVRRAITMIQAAVMADKNDERRAMVKWDVPGDPRECARMLDESLRAMNKAVLEHDTLAAELEQARIDRDERLTLRESSRLARMVDEERANVARLEDELAAVLAQVNAPIRDPLGTVVPVPHSYHDGCRLADPAGARPGCRACLADEAGSPISRLTSAGMLMLTSEPHRIDPADDGELVAEVIPADPAPVAPPVLSDGGHVFMALLLCLGRPTKDGRTLASMGAYALVENRHGVPLQKLVDPDSKHQVTDTVGRIMGVIRDGDEVLALGVAEPEIAAGLNRRELCLAADLEADPQPKPADGAASGLLFLSARVRGARVRDGGDFAWEM